MALIGVWDTQGVIQGWFDNTQISAGAWFDDDGASASTGTSITFSLGNPLESLSSASLLLKNLQEFLSTDQWSLPLPAELLTNSKLVSANPLEWLLLSTTSLKYLSDIQSSASSSLPLPYEWQGTAIFVTATYNTPFEFLATQTRSLKDAYEALSLVQGSFKYLEESLATQRGGYAFPAEAGLLARRIAPLLEEFAATQRSSYGLLNELLSTQRLTRGQPDELLATQTNALREALEALSSQRYGATLLDELMSTDRMSPVLKDEFSAGQSPSIHNLLEALCTQRSSLGRPLETLGLFSGKSVAPLESVTTAKPSMATRAELLAGQNSAMKLADEFLALCSQRLPMPYEFLGSGLTVTLTALLPLEILASVRYAIREPGEWVVNVSRSLQLRNELIANLGVSTPLAGEATSSMRYAGARLPDESVLAVRSAPHNLLEALILAGPGAKLLAELVGRTMATGYLPNDYLSAWSVATKMLQESLAGSKSLDAMTYESITSALSAAALPYQTSPFLKTVLAVYSFLASLALRQSVAVDLAQKEAVAVDLSKKIEPATY
jgi:hypothetical protein